MVTGIQWHLRLPYESVRSSDVKCCSFIYYVAICILTVYSVHICAISFPSLYIGLFRNYILFTWLLKHLDTYTSDLFPHQESHFNDLTDHFLPSILTSSSSPIAEADIFGKPPSYEDAVLMEDPPPAYSEVLADIRGGTYTKPDARTPREPQDAEKSEMRPEVTLSARAYSPLIQLPAAEHWHSLGCFLSTVDMNRNNLPLPASGPSVRDPPPLRGSLSGGQLPDRPLPDQTCDLPTAILVFSRSTAV